MRTEHAAQYASLLTPYRMGFISGIIVSRIRHAARKPDTLGFAGKPPP